MCGIGRVITLLNRSFKPSCQYPVPSSQFEKLIAETAERDAEFAEKAVVGRWPLAEPRASSNEEWRTTNDQRLTVAD